MSDNAPSVNCDHCDDEGVVYESCGCCECEYDNKHGRYLPCANCQPEAMDRRPEKGRYVVPTKGVL